MTIVTGAVLTDYDFITKVEVQLYNDKSCTTPLILKKSVKMFKEELMDQLTTENFHPIRCELIYGR